MERYERYKDSGVEWIGEIPEGWEVKKLSYCFDNIGSGTTPTSGNTEYYFNGNINWLQTGDLNDGEILCTSKKITSTALNAYSTLRIYPAGSIVIAMYGATIGKTGLLKISTTTNQACCVLSDANNVLSKFAFYWLNSIKEHVISLSYGGGQPNINQEMIRSLKIQLPSPEDQTSIANYLDRKTTEIDKLIAQKERLIELYEEEKTAIINQAVTKGIDPDVKLKDSGVDWLGEIPEGWEVKRLKYVGLFINGFSFSSDDFAPSGIRVLKISNIQHMRIDWSDESFINEIFYESHSSFRVFKNDLVFALTRPIISTGIKAAIIDTEDKILLNQRNSIFRTQKIETEWIYYIVLSTQFINEFDMRIDKTGQQPNISSNDIGDIAIPVPSKEDQAVIICKLKTEISRIQAKIEKTKRILELQKEYRTALISEVVTGKIKVTEETTP
jgi:type I restriction enzyme, S subunit